MPFPRLPVPQFGAAFFSLAFSDHPHLCNTSIALIISSKWLPPPGLPQSSQYVSLIWNGPQLSVPTSIRHFPTLFSHPSTYAAFDTVITEPSLYKLNKKLCYQTDRATRYVSHSPVNCRNKLYNKSTTNWSNGVRPKFHYFDLLWICCGLIVDLLAHPAARRWAYQTLLFLYLPLALREAHAALFTK